MRRHASNWLGVSGTLLALLLCLPTFTPSSLRSDPGPDPPSGPAPQDAELDDEDSGTSGSDDYTPPPLWLAVGSLSTQCLELVVHGTQPFVTYEIESQETLSETWRHELMVTGALAQAFTPCVVSLGDAAPGRFFRARAVVDDPMSGVPLSELQLWLKADTGVVMNATNNRVSAWQDQSGQGNHAVQSSTSFQPVWVEAVLNEQPVMRFVPNSFLGLPNFLSTNTAGEAFVLLKVATNPPASTRALWRWGTSSTASWYPHYNRALADAFGRTSYVDLGAPHQTIEAFHLYNVSASMAEWSARINGRTLHQTAGSAVTFPTNPNLGYGASGCYFDGDVAELMLFGRVLSAAERDAVGRYLNGRHGWLRDAPAVPAGLGAVALASNQVSVTWTALAGAATTVYQIERRIGMDGSFGPVASVRDASAWLDTGLVGGTRYGYRVRAWNYAGESGWSAEAVATTPDHGPGLPLENLQLWLRADAGVVRNGASGTVRLWFDQSGRGHHAYQFTAAQQPSWVESAVNGRPVVRFDPATYQRMHLPELVSSNVAGEIFAVVRAATNRPASSRGLWHLGASSTANYYPLTSGAIYEGFGRAAQLNTGIPHQSLEVFHLYNVSATEGAWANRLNGRIHYQTEAFAGGFPSSVYLGASGDYGTPTFDGELAEVLLFDRALHAVERDAVGEYLNRKYQWWTNAPEPPGALVAMAVGRHQVSVTWTHTLGPATTVFKVERREGANGSFTEVARVRDATSWLDTTVRENAPYDYRIKAWSYAGESAWTEVVSVVTPGEGNGLPLEAVQLWLMADAGVVAQGATGSVGLWLDQSGHHHHAYQTTPTEQPAVVDHVLNGRPVVRFNPSTYQRMRLPDFLSSNNEAEIFAVVRAATNTPAVARGLWRLGAASLANLYPQTTGAIYEGFGRADNLNTGLPSPPLDTFHLYQVSASPAGWLSRLNGQVHFCAALPVVQFPTALWLGASGEAGTPSFDGDVAELVLFRRVLAVDERAAVSAYLNGKYRFADPPTDPIVLHAQTLSSSQIALSWVQSGASNPPPVTYTLERRVGAQGPFTGIAQISGTSRHVDAGLTPDTAYQYRIRSTLLAGAPPSNVVAANTLSAGEPMPLTEIALWLRADDLPPAEGSAVAQWKDFWNPNLHAVQPDPAWQPTWRASNFNQRAAVAFADGAYLQLPTVMSNASAADMFVVLHAAMAAPSTHRGLWRFNSSGPTWFPDTNGAVCDALGSTSAHASLAPLPDLTRPLIYNVSATTGLWQSRFNGPLKQTLATNTVHFSGVPLLGRSSGDAAEAFAGQVAELILFKRVLTALERKAVRDGLALKYGLTLEAPFIPGHLTMTRPDPTERHMTWDALVGSENGLESRFVVERQAHATGAFLPVGWVSRTASSFMDGLGLPEVAYQYRLRAINEVGETVSGALTAPLLDTDDDGLADVIEAALATQSEEADSDGDGLPDGWEVRHGLNPLRADSVYGAAGDFDHDGQSNADEYAQGTHPADGTHGASPKLRLQVHRPN